ncbi:hypothetical protein A9995_04630 [Erythrobacter sp. QSSC1-22B]|uniref:hypothetical protein n=1 Tax=Erythrobacter sp. QSSC1-22B TaxID=1860125 RepID=UPI000805F48B|nr:hypothetical protein [Erythrobacter sp. QSSC1-22B]OBX19845.1 hypothetical protein A9995_04630 [Erythrobacter sp. QSSC1-22B]
MENLLTSLRDNGEVIADASFAALTWAILIGALMFALVRALKANQIGDLQSRLSLRDDEISDYRRKSEAASPVEAAARIEALESEIALLRPRSLTAAQAQKITEPVQNSTGQASVAANMASPDASAFAAAIGRAFQKAGWIVSTPAVLGMSNSPARGWV